MYIHVLVQLKYTWLSAQVLNTLYYSECSIYVQYRENIYHIHVAGFLHGLQFLFEAENARNLSLKNLVLAYLVLCMLCFLQKLTLIIKKNCLQKYLAIRYF